MRVKIVKYFMLPLCLLLLVPGSVQARQMPSLPVVEQVDVECRQGAVRQRRHYTSGEKMSWVLNYLRMQKNLGKPEKNPEQTGGDSYTIRVFLSDGHQVTYRQRSDRYFCRDDQPWQMIDPDWGGCFYYLLQTLPSDPVGAAEKTGVDAEIHSGLHVLISLA